MAVAASGGRLSAATAPSTSPRLRDGFRHQPTRPLLANRRKCARMALRAFSRAQKTGLPPPPPTILRPPIERENFSGFVRTFPLTCSNRFSMLHQPYNFGGTMTPNPMKDLYPRIPFQCPTCSRQYLGKPGDVVPDCSVCDSPTVKASPTSINRNDIDDARVCARCRLVHFDNHRVNNRCPACPSPHATRLDRFVIV